MKRHFAFGFAGLLGAGAAALAIEPPGTAAPIPPQASAGQVAAASEPESEFKSEPLPPAATPAPAAERAYLGVGASQIPDLLGEHLGLAAGQGVVVRSLDPAGPAAKAGLANNDVITKVAGRPVASHEQLRDAIAALKPGDAVDIDFIHRGEAKVARVTLAGAPADPGALSDGSGPGAGLAPLDGLMLDGMPEEQAKRVREAIEQNLKAFGEIGAEGGIEGLLGGGIGKRMERMFEGLAVPDAGGDAGAALNLRSSSTIRMLDDEGSVELKSQDGGKTVRVFGNDGEVQWEGPYDTPQDKEAAPPEVRERIDRLNIDMDFKGGGLRLRMLPKMGPAGE